MSGPPILRRVTQDGGNAVTGPSRLRQLHALTSVRFFAAAWVVLFHFRDHIEVMLPGLRAIGALLDTGYLGVDLFFLLSGFIITYNYSERLEHPTWPAYRQFLGLRLARFYPVHIATLATIALLVALAALVHHPLHGSFTVVDAVRQLLLVVTWGPESSSLSWNQPAWSISAEWAAYLCFPFIAVALRPVHGLLLAAGRWPLAARLGA